MDNETGNRTDEIITEEKTDISAEFEEEKEPAEAGPEPDAKGTADAAVSAEERPQDPAVDVTQENQPKESRRERKAREKEEARLEKERAKQRAKDEKAAARAAKKAERKYRNIPTVIIMSLILAVLVAGLGFLGWKHIGLLQDRDDILAEKEKLSAEMEDLGKTLADKEAQISEQLSQIEEKNALISDGDAAVKEFSAKVTELEDELKGVRDEAAEVLDIISGKKPLGISESGSFSADSAVVIIEDGGSFSMNITAMYGEKETVISYSMDESSKNIGTFTLKSAAITGSSGLISGQVKKQNADETGLAVLKFENDHSSDIFYVIIVIK